MWEANVESTAQEVENTLPVVTTLASTDTVRVVKGGSSAQIALSNFPAAGSGLQIFATIAALRLNSTAYGEGIACTVTSYAGTNCLGGGTIVTNTKITAQLTGTAGGIGTYSVSISQTVASTTITQTQYLETGQQILCSTGTQLKLTVVIGEVLTTTVGSVSQHDLIVSRSTWRHHRFGTLQIKWGLVFVLLWPAVVALPWVARFGMRNARAGQQS